MRGIRSHMHLLLFFSAQRAVSYDSLYTHIYTKCICTHMDDSFTLIDGYTI